MDNRHGDEPQAPDVPSPDEAVFEPVRLTKARRSTFAIAIAAVVVGLALVGLVGGAGGGGGGRDESSAREPSWARATAARPILISAADRAAAREAPWRTRPGTGEPTEPSRRSFGDLGWPPSLVAVFVPVQLDRYEVLGDELTDDVVAVEGTLRIKADWVRVSLQTLELESLVAKVVDTSNVDGGIRPERGPGFDVELAIPTPRPIGERLWVVITAYDEAGSPLGTLRRLVTIEELAR